MRGTNAWVYECASRTHMYGLTCKLQFYGTYLRCVEIAKCTDPVTVFKLSSRSSEWQTC